mgnify:CR=1 FL=1
MSYDLKRISDAVDQFIHKCQSPEVAAGELGISKSTLYNLRSCAIADPGIRVISLLADGLDKSIDEICGSDYYVKLFERAEELKRKLERAEWIIDELRESRPQGLLPREGLTEPQVPRTQGEDFLSRSHLTESTEQVLAKIAGSYAELRDEIERGAAD